MKTKTRQRTGSRSTLTDVVSASTKYSSKFGIGAEPFSRADRPVHSENQSTFFHGPELEIHSEFSRCFLRMFQNEPFINLGTDHPATDFTPSRSPRLIEHVDSKRYFREEDLAARFTERIFPGRLVDSSFVTLFVTSPGNIPLT